MSKYHDYSFIIFAGSVPASMVLNHGEEDKIFLVDELGQTTASKKAKSLSSANKMSSSSPASVSRGGSLNKKNKANLPDSESEAIGSKLADFAEASSDRVEDLPEKEVRQIELVKGNHGLGITVAGYVCEKGSSC